MLDFSTYEDSVVWKTRFRFVIKEAQKAMNLEYIKLRVPHAGADTRRALLNKAKQLLTPWLRSKPESDMLLDQVAQWYIINRREVLEDLGVDFGKLQSSS